MTVTAFSTEILGTTHNFGLCEAVGTELFGTRLNVWFASPTGGESDSIVFALDAETSEQAKNWERFVRAIAQI